MKKRVDVAEATKAESYQRGMKDHNGRVAALEAENHTRLQELAILRHENEKVRSVPCPLARTQPLVKFVHSRYSCAPN